MIRGDLVRAVAAEHSLAQAQADKILDTVLGAIKSALAGGDKVTLTGFGVFETTIRAAITGRNPATGQALEIPEQRVPKFRPGKALKNAVALRAA